MTLVPIHVRMNHYNMIGFIVSQQFLFNDAHLFIIFGIVNV